MPRLRFIAKCALSVARRDRDRVPIQSAAVFSCARAFHLPPASAQAGVAVELWGSRPSVYRGAELMSVSRRQGWTCFLVNQLACPGIGTIMAGRRVIGFVQAAVMIVGFCTVLAYFAMYLAALYKFAMDASATEAKWKAMQPPMWMIIGGFGLTAVAWFWSLFSSFQILHESRRNQPV
jgi:hypothetical protein